MAKAKRSSKKKTATKTAKKKLAKKVKKAVKKPAKKPTRKTSGKKPVAKTLKKKATKKKVTKKTARKQPVKKKISSGKGFKRTGEGIPVADLKDKACVVGVGTTEFSKNSGRSELSLACESILDAIYDAGLKPSDVDGMVTFTMDTNDEIEIARAIGTNDLSFYSRVPHGGGGPTGCIEQAVMAIATGVAEVVVCYRALNGRSGHRFSSGVSGDIVTGDMIHYGWYLPYGLITPASWVAMYHRRYEYLYGNTRDALAEIAMTTRDYAVTNPRAFFHKRPLSREEYDKGKAIALPFNLYDCCQESDGGCAVVLTTPERAKHLNQLPVAVKGVGMCAEGDTEAMTNFYAEEIAQIPAMDHAAKQAYAQSGLTANDIDAAIIYDAFTAIVMWQLESWGFADYGKSAEFVLSGALRRDGRLPTNTHGGQLSEAYIHGMNGVNEGVRLVRGTSNNQPNKKIDNVLVTSGVGVPTGGMLLGKLDG
jgi:acetyl-CoA acetyltransferase